MESNALHTPEAKTSQPTMTVTLTNNRMEEGRWNRLLTILFTPQDENPQAAAA